MKRIIIDARQSGTSTGRYVDKLIEYLHKLPADYEFVVLAKKHRLKFFHQLAPNYQVVECPFREFSFGEQLGFWRQIHRLKPGLVFFPMVQQPVLYFGRTVTTMQDLTTTRFRNTSKQPVVFWVKQQVYKFVNWWVAKKSRHIITFSHYVKQDVAAYAHIKPSKITAIHLAADKITDKPEPFTKVAGKKFLLYVGRPLSHKNLNRLVMAFASLLKSDPDLRLVLVGKTDKPYEQLQDYVKQQDVPNVIFSGFVSDGQLRWLYEHTAAYVFPSLSEGFGLPPLEAMHFGAPVVSSKATSLPEVCQDAALYFDPFNVDDMTQKIKQVLDDPKLAQDLAVKGKKLLSTYSWERTAQQTLAVLEDALA